MPCDILSVKGKHMNTKRITITKDMKNEIKRLRKEIGYTAVHLSQKCKGVDYWIQNIENNRITTMSVDDAYKLFSLLYEEEVKKNKNYISEKLEEFELFDFDSLSSKETQKKYEFKNTRKEYRRKLKHAYDELLKMLDEAGETTDASVYLEKMAILTTFTELMNGQAQRKIFDAIFSIPLQTLGLSNMEVIKEYLQEQTNYKYPTIDEVDDGHIPEIKLINQDDSLFY